MKKRSFIFCAEVIFGGRQYELKSPFCIARKFWKKEWGVREKFILLEVKLWRRNGELRKKLPLTYLRLEKFRRKNEKSTRLTFETPSGRARHCEEHYGVIDRRKVQRRTDGCCWAAWELRFSEHAAENIGTPGVLPRLRKKPLPFTKWSTSSSSKGLRRRLDDAKIRFRSDDTDLKSDQADGPTGEIQRVGAKKGWRVQILVFHSFPCFQTWWTPAITVRRVMPSPGWGRLKSSRESCGILKRSARSIAMHCAPEWNEYFSGSFGQGFHGPSLFVAKTLQFRGAEPEAKIHEEFCNFGPESFSTLHVWYRLIMFVQKHGLWRGHGFLRIGIGVIRWTSTCWALSETTAEAVSQGSGQRRNTFSANVAPATSQLALAALDVHQFM